MKTYRHLLIENEDGVTRVVMNRPESLNAANHELHGELGDVWDDLRRDKKTRAVLVSGAGKAFSAGGDLKMIEEICGDIDAVVDSLEQTARIVHNMLSFEKPVVSAIHGTAVGAGLAVGLMADISIVGEHVHLSDGHARLGVAAGDHAAIVWPLLCGMAKAKRYLLTGDFISGAEAERIGLVSCCVPDDKVQECALDFAVRLAKGSELSLRWTKRSLNNWMYMMKPAFDASVAFEHLCLLGEDLREGLSAVRARRSAEFPSAARG